MSIFLDYVLIFVFEKSKLKKLVKFLTYLGHIFTNDFCFREADHWLDKTNLAGPKTVERSNSSQQT